jgi:hypothetical protein
MRIRKHKGRVPSALAFAGGLIILLLSGGCIDDQTDILTCRIQFTPNFAEVTPGSTVLVTAKLLNSNSEPTSGTWRIENFVSAYFSQVTISPVKGNTATITIQTKADISLEGTPFIGYDDTLIVVGATPDIPLMNSASGSLSVEIRQPVLQLTDFGFSQGYDPVKTILNDHRTLRVSLTRKDSNDKYTISVLSVTPCYVAGGKPLKNPPFVPGVIDRLDAVEFSLGETFDGKGAPISSIRYVIEVTATSGTKIIRKTFTIGESLKWSP